MDDFNITINGASQLIVSENKGINSYSKKKTKKKFYFVLNAAIQDPTTVVCILTIK